MSDRQEETGSDQNVIEFSREEIVDLTFAENATYMVTSRCPGERGILEVSFAVITPVAILCNASDLKRACEKPFCTECWLKEIQDAVEPN